MSNISDSNTNTNIASDTEQDYKTKYPYHHLISKTDDESQDEALATFQTDRIIDPQEFGKQDNDGNTILHIAATVAFDELLKLLLSRADISNFLGQVNKDNNTFIHLLAEKSHDHSPIISKVVNILLSFNHSNNSTIPGTITTNTATASNTTTSSSTTTTTTITNNSNMFNKHNKKGETILYLLIKNKHYASIQKIIPHILTLQIELEHMDSNSNTLLHILAYYSSSYEYFKQFIKQSIDKALVEKMVNTRNTNNKETPLHIVCRNNNEDVYKLLTDFNADPNIKNKYNQTPIFVAFAEEKYDMIKNLLEYHHKLNINEVNNEGDTILHKIMTINNGNIFTNIIKEILKSYPDIDEHIKNKQGKTAFEYGTEYNKTTYNTLRQQTTTTTTTTTKENNLDTTISIEENTSNINKYNNK